MHQLSDTMSNELLMHKVDDMFDRSLSRLSLCRAFQPTGKHCVENCRFAGYTGYADMYKADIVSIDQSSLLPVRVLVKFCQVMC